jgi:RND superfamily putative drug exporter
VRADKIFGAIGSFAVKFRWLVVVAWIAAAVVISGALPSLSSVTQANNSDFLPAGAPSQHAADLAAPFGSTNLIPVPVVVANPSGTLNTTWVAGLEAAFKKVRTVVGVHDLGVSSDRHAQMLQVMSNVSGSDEAGQKTLIDTLRSTIRSANPPPGTQAHLAGTIAINVDQQAKSGNTNAQIELGSLVLVLVILFLVFRALLAPFLTLIPAAISVVISGPLVAEAAKHGLKVSFLAEVLLTVLVIGAGTDYGLFLVFRVRENLREGMERRQAVIAAVTKVGESITFSAATVVAALLSLLAASFQIYSNLGVPLAIGIAVMLLAGLTLTPALLAIFGRAVFWPTRNREGQSVEGAWGKLAGRIIQRPAIPLTIGVVVFAALSVAVAWDKPAGFGGSISAPAGTDSAAGTTLMNKYFPTTAANPTNLVYKLSTPFWDDPGKVTAAEQQLNASGLFTGVTGPLNPVAGVTLTPVQYTELHAALGDPRSVPSIPPAGSRIPAVGYEVYRATAQYVSPDGTVIQFQTALKAGDPSSTAAMNAVPSIRAEAARVAGTLGASDYGVAGEAPAFNDISSISNNDLGHVIPIAIVVIGLLLAIVMRSLIAPLYLIASVALSYFAAFGLAVLLFIELGHSGGLVFFLPFMLFIFLLALGEDYNILVMSRIREEAQNLPLRRAVTRAVGSTGTTVTSAGLVLAGTFVVLGVVGGGSGSSQFRDLGLGLALGIMMDTFVVRTVLVPCTVVLLGRWNWWPAQLGKVVTAGGAHAQGATTWADTPGDDRYAEAERAGSPDGG